MSSKFIMLPFFVLLVLHASSNVDGLPSTTHKLFIKSMLDGFSLDSPAYIISKDCSDQVTENEMTCTAIIDNEWDNEGRNDGSEKSDCCKYWAIERCLMAAKRDKCTPVENMSINDGIRKHFRQIESAYCSKFPSNDKTKCKYDQND